MGIKNYLRSAFKGAQSINRLIDSAVLSSNGWQVESYNNEESLGPQAYYYLHDVPSGWTWMCSVSLPAAKKITQDIGSHPEFVQNVRDRLGALIYKKSLNLAINDLSEDLSWEDELALWVCAYSGSTQALKLTGGVEAYQHFIVLNYRAPHGSDSLLRPFIIPSDVRGPLEHTAFHSALAQVISLDKERHPEWFKGMQA